MSREEHLFVQSAEPVVEEAALLKRLMNLEPIPDPAAHADDQVGLRGRATTGDGWMGYLIEPNYLRGLDPEPDEFQAIDGYPLMITIWHGARDAAVQLREARLVFDRMVEARADVPLLLCDGIDLLAAAYLPGAGVHDFPKGTTMDAPDLSAWQPWVSG